MSPKQILNGMAERAAQLNDTLAVRKDEFRELMVSFGKTVTAGEKGSKAVLDLTTFELHFVGLLFRFVHRPSLNMKSHFVEIHQRIEDINAAVAVWRHVGTLEIADGTVADDEGHRHRLDSVEAAALPLWVRVFNAVDNPNGNLS
mgnify:CR=1 FL=1